MREQESGDLSDGKALWLITNKCDVLSQSESQTLQNCMEVRPHFVISTKTGAGVGHLLDQLGKFAGSYFKPSEPAVVTRERQRQMLEHAQAALRRAVCEGTEGREEVVAEELRVASHALGRLVGRVDVEDVLDAIFRDFCIGK